MAQGVPRYFLFEKMDFLMIDRAKVESFFANCQFLEPTFFSAIVAHAGTTEF